MRINLDHQTVAQQIVSFGCALIFPVIGVQWAFVLWGQKPKAQKSFETKVKIYLYTKTHSWTGVSLNGNNLVQESFSWSSLITENNNIFKKVIQTKHR